ncbi:MAG TPA: glycosyltransferase family 39 protein [Streptosporangiaceae bacterium]
MTAVAARRPAWPRAATAAGPGRARIALGVLLAGTALLYLAGLSRNGWANDFYAAAVQAGTRSWKAFFFGSFDASSFITVDKTPASLWVMELSARLFGLNYWSMLVPQALAGVGSVALLHATVRRWFGPAAGLLAGAALALTPVAALMFRFNNPDALLVLLMTAAAYGIARAIESGRTRWLLLAGALIGLGFLAKMLQAFLVVPGFGLAYLIAGPPRLRTRIWQLLAALAAVIAAAGWWVAAVMLTPAASRPYVGGSTSDSILQLALGYNGLGRLDGNETGSVGFGGAAAGRGGGGGGAAFGGAAGLQRLFASEMGGQISWLLPAALLAMAALGWLAWRSSRSSRSSRSWRGSAAGPGMRTAGPSGPGPQPGPAARGARLRSDPALAALLLWGGWLLVTGLVFSFMAGIIHPYYTVALAPPIAALAGTGAVALWRERAGWPARGLLAAGVAVTACWSYLLLARSPSWYPELRWAVLVIGLASAVVLALSPRPGTGRVTVAGVAAAGAIAAALAGPAAYSLDTAATAHAGALPTAGPAVTSAFAGPGRAGGPGGAGAAGGFGGPGAAGRAGGSGGPGTAPGTGTGAGTGTGRPGGTARAPSGVPGAGGPGGTGTGTGTGTGRFPARAGAGAPGTGTAAPGAGGPGGGLGGSTQVSKALAALLERDASAYTWAAATVGSESAAPLQLATGQPVMSIGGFNGTDPAPTLAQFKKLVAEHKIHYFVGQNAHSFGGGSGSASAISSWVAAHFTARTVGGETVYDLTGSS